MGAGESIHQSKVVEDDVVVTDEGEVDEEEEAHSVHRKIEKLKKEDQKAKKEVEDINMEMAPLRRERNKRRLTSTAE